MSLGKGEVGKWRQTSYDFAIGRFDLGSSGIQLRQATATPRIRIADASIAKEMQVYLYWPTVRRDPLLIDDTGLYPLLSTPLFAVRMPGTGNGLIEVVPHLSYKKGGKALSKAQLQEFWGE